MPEVTSVSLQELWRTALPRLAEQVGQATCDTFLRNTVPLTSEAGTFVLGVPNEFAKSWLEERHSSVICACLTELLDEPVGLQMQVIESDNKRPPAPAPLPAAIRAPGGERDFWSVPLNPKYTFDNFVVADCNRFAHAAAQQVARSPGKSYNPLFIHSKVGLGKTHLLQAIGHIVVEGHPEAQVVYISAEDFVNQLITAMRDNRMSAFRHKHRYVDVWLVDDIQFIATIDGPVSEEEFFHTFNTLCETNKQVVIASDAPPRHLQVMNARLRSRLEMGIVADLRCPDVETRVAILEKKAEAEGVTLSREILEYVAKKIESNVRVLEGALLKICAYVSLTDEEITLDRVREIIADYSTGSSTQRITIQEIVEHVAAQMDCPVDTMRGPKRNQEVVWPRQVAIYLARELTDMSLAAIGKYFDGRDHSTVLHAYNKVSDLLTNDESVLWLINDCKGALQAQ